MLDSTFFTSMSSVMTQWNDFRVSKNLYKAYFNMQKEQTKSATAETQKTAEKKTTAKNKVEDKLGKLSSSMSSSVSGLESAFAVDKETGDIDYDKAFKAAESFVNSYNDLVSNIRGSGDQSVSNKQEFISNMTNAYSKRLKDVGITIQSDGKLSIDKDTFSTASQEKLDKIFGKDNSFASFMGSQAKQLANYAAIEHTNNAKTYTQSGKTAAENALTSGAILNLLS